MYYLKKSISASSEHKKIIFFRSVQTSRSLLHSLDARRSPPSREPSTRTRLWKPRKKMSEMYEYTVKRLPFPKSSGRGPNGKYKLYCMLED